MWKLFLKRLHYDKLVKDILKVYFSKTILLLKKKIVTRDWFYCTVNHSSKEIDKV